MPYSHLTEQIFQTIFYPKKNNDITVHIFCLMNVIAMLVW